VLPFGRLCYGEPNAISNAIGYARHYSRLHDAVIRVYDAARNVIETHEQKAIEYAQFAARIRTKVGRLTSWNICLTDAWKPTGRAVRHFVERQIKLAAT
jgi:hypothetical protein